MDIKTFLKPAEQSAIKEAIQEAERVTSGEIRLHLESKVNQEDIMKRGMEVFNDLKLFQTEKRNGILFYLAVEDRKFAILGDDGINTVVPLSYWDDLALQLREYFKVGKFSEGLIFGINVCGKKLAEKFPFLSNDINELSDEISFGE